MPDQGRGQAQGQSDVNDHPSNSVSCPYLLDEFARVTLICSDLPYDPNSCSSPFLPRAIWSKAKRSSYPSDPRSRCRPVSPHPQRSFKLPVNRSYQL
jgi:hypothetical protein